MITREERYLVFKLTDLSVLTSDERDTLNKLMEKVTAGRKENGKQPLVTVSIESTWPEYEPVWEMLEKRMNG